MRNLMIIVVLLLGTKTGLCQPPSLVGTWSFSGDSTVASYYFRNDGGVSIHIGLKDGVILAENLKHGTYVIKDNLITIKWANNSLERIRFKFIDQDNLQLSGNEKTTTKRKSGVIYKRFIYNGTVEVKKMTSFVEQQPLLYLI